MTTKFYLDTRSVEEGQEAPVKLGLNSHGSSAYITTHIKVLPTQWDTKTGKIVGHPLKSALNLKLISFKADVEKIIDEESAAGHLRGLSLGEVRKYIINKMKGGDGGTADDFITYFDTFGARKEKHGTRKTYVTTSHKLHQFCGTTTLLFPDITRQWLTAFEAFLAETGVKSQNARAIHLRNIRTVFNDALNNGVTDTAYPFRKFKIRNEPTRDRSIDRDTLRRFFGADCTEAQAEYRDIFRLSFCLCGANIADLARLTEIRNGRVEFQRTKTGQPVSIGVQPEAEEIIGRLRGRGHLLSFADRYGNYADYLHHLNTSIKHIGQTYNPHTKKWEGEPIVPDISFYYARYSWATIAAELDVPERTIGAALGHSTRGRVTSIYTRVDMRKKIDAANRAVLDFIFCAE